MAVEVLISSNMSESQTMGVLFSSEKVPPATVGNVDGPIRVLSKTEERVFRDFIIANMREKLRCDATSDTGTSSLVTKALLKTIEKLDLSERRLFLQGAQLFPNITGSVRKVAVSGTSHTLQFYGCCDTANCHLTDKLMEMPELCHHLWLHLHTYEHTAGAPEISDLLIEDGNDLIPFSQMFAKGLTQLEFNCICAFTVAASMRHSLLEVLVLYRKLLDQETDFSGQTDMKVEMREPGSHPGYRVYCSPFDLISTVEDHKVVSPLHFPQNRLAKRRRLDTSNSCDGKSITICARLPSPRDQRTCMSTRTLAEPSRMKAITGGTVLAMLRQIDKCAPASAAVATDCKK